MGYSPWDCRESDTTERLSTTFLIAWESIGESMIWREAILTPTPWQVAGLRGRWDRNWRQAGRRWIRFIRVYILKLKGNAGKTSVGRWAWKFFSSLLLMPCFSHLFLPSGMTSGWSEGASALSGCLHIYKARFHVWAYFILTTFCVLSRFSHVRLFATLWTIAYQTPLSMGFSRQEYWS